MKLTLAAALAGLTILVGGAVPAGASDGPPWLLCGVSADGRAQVWCPYSSYRQLDPWAFHLFARRAVPPSTGVTSRAPSLTHEERNRAKAGASIINPIFAPG